MRLSEQTARVDREDRDPWRMFSDQVDYYLIFQPKTAGKCDSLAENGRDSLGGVANNKASGHSCNIFVCNL